LKPKEKRSIDLVKKYEISRWIRHWFQESYEFGIRKTKWSESHDYHIFMERLLPVMFCGYLNDDVWTALAELSHFYRQLCAKEIKKKMMEKLEEEIPVIICKLEKIFPLG
jgi:hypothetical protein